MYNEELKSRFIDEFTKSSSRKEAARVFFNSLEPYEVKWGSDICTRNKEEIESAMDKLVGSRTRSAVTRTSILRVYLKWCVENQVPGAHIVDFDDKHLGTEKFAMQYVSGPLHLQRFLDAVLDKESLETNANIYRCIFWLAFGGMPEQYIYNVRAGDVDFDSMSVIYNTGTLVSNTYLIYREAVPAFRNCVMLTAFARSDKRVGTPRETRYDRAPGDLLLRGKEGGMNVNTMRTIVNECNRKAREKLRKGEIDPSLGLSLSYDRVWLSGFCYRTYEIERAGDLVDGVFGPASKLYVQDNPLGRETSHKAQVRRANSMARDFRKNYARWKSVYSR